MSKLTALDAAVYHGGCKKVQQQSRATMGGAPPAAHFFGISPIRIGAWKLSYFEGGAHPKELFGPPLLGSIMQAEGSKTAKLGRRERALLVPKC
jgi:hypothetical protein